MNDHQRNGRRACLLGATLGMVAMLTPQTLGAHVPTPPTAPVLNVTNTYFGIKVADPYRWMEDWNSEKFRAWLKAENDFTRATLDGLPARTKLLAELRRLDRA